jgi:ABC-type lipoprotein export system ATPase subunit
MSAAAIAGEDLFLIYRTGHGDVSALRGLDLTVAAGERVAVLGPSGAGKSSLLALCAGFARPSSGRLRVADTAIEAAGSRRLAALRRDELGIVRQHFRRSLPEELTAQEIVGLPLRLAGRDPGRRPAELLRRAGLGDRLQARPPELSGGEQQRVAVCAALAKAPRVVLADEPTGELDRPTSAAVVELLLGLAEDAAVLVVTHDLAVAARADRIVHVRDGRVSAEGEAEQDLVVDDQGWLRLPRELREQAGIGRHVHAAPTPRGIELVALAGARHAGTADDRDAAGGSATTARGGGGSAVTARGEAGGAATAGRAGDAAGLAVTLRGVSKAYGDRAVLRGLTHEFAAGTLHVVAGPSGSGKTTLLSLLAALDAADAGTLAAGGEPFEHLRGEAAAAWRRAHVGYLSQQPLLAGHLSARENVALAVQLRSRHDPGSAERWLEWVGLAPAADRPAASLSGGEQRRVGLAQAMAGEPAILLVDEPTAHLDRASGRQVVALLHRAAHEHGATVIASTHDTDLIAAADEVVDLA